MSFSSMVAITVPMPAVNPVVTGEGMNSMNFPMRRAPSIKRISPASMPAVSKPPRPCLA